MNKEGYLWVARCSAAESHCVSQLSWNFLRLPPPQALDCRHVPCSPTEDMFKALFPVSAGYCGGSHGRLKGGGSAHLKLQLLPVSLLPLRPTVAAL